MKYIELTESGEGLIVCVNVDAIVSFYDHTVITVGGGLILCKETKEQIKDKLRHI
jgi:hypothetical protein